MNQFWTLSATSGLAGTPTRFLVDFDPIATPELLVAPMRAMAPTEVLELFISSNDELLTLLDTLDEHQWSTLAETPPGDLPIRLLASHGLWDGWVHERDILIPLGGDQPEHDDEIVGSLRYVCALIAGLALLSGVEVAGPLGVRAADPHASFVVTLAERVEVLDAPPEEGSCTLRGDAVGLLEALSTRASFPVSPTGDWDVVLQQFASVFSPHA